MDPNKKIKASEILRQYLRNKYSRRTEEKIQQWLIRSPKSEEKERASKEFWESLETGKNKETYNALKRVNLKIGIRSNDRILSHSIFWRAAAILIFIVGISGIWLYNYRANNPTMLEVSTLYGETKQIILPDESVVWLNAGSLLKYPSNFNKKKRLVSLKGEAFFSVTKDNTKPFIVDTKNLFVKVLGTKFNLRTYPGEKHTVATLQEGKIEIQTGDQQNEKLHPYEQLVYNNLTSTMEVVKIPHSDIPDWKNGNLLFLNVTLGEIFQTLKRHFNVSIDLDKSLEQSTDYYTIKFNRGENLEQILQILEDVTGNFSYSLDSNQAVIKKK